MAHRWCSTIILAIGSVGLSRAAASALDELALIQRDTRLEPDAPAAPSKTNAPEQEEAQESSVPMTMLSQRRQLKSVIMMRAELDKYFLAQNQADRFRETAPDLQTISPAQIMEMLPAMMDALRDDNFIRSFIQFEDTVEHAGKDCVRDTSEQLQKYLKSANSTQVQLTEQSKSDTQATVRIGFARFLDQWKNQLLAGYGEKLTKVAEVFQHQVGGSHQLSHEFADLFVPLFKNGTKKLTTHTIGGNTVGENASAAQSFEEFYRVNSEADFCLLMGEVVHNASKSSSESTHVLKILNSTRKMAVPMMGRYMTDMLPGDASEEDKNVPTRMMLIMDYEVSAMYAGITTLRDMSGEIARGLGPLLKEGLGCENSGASGLSFGLAQFLAALLALALGLHLSL